MHVGEPPFAAQLTTKTGETLAFDDPGCLFHYVEEHGPDVHAIWFHHVREDRWIAAAEVAFTAIEPTPMGFGIGAVDAGTAAAIDLEGARRRCLGANAGADAPAGAIRDAVCALVDLPRREVYQRVLEALEDR